MVSCHALAQFEGQFIGDPLDIEMFEATGWKINEAQKGNELGIVELDNFEPAIESESGKNLAWRYF